MYMSAVYSRTVKYNAVLVAAALVTFLLLFFMQYLIENRNSAFEAPRVTRVVDATMPLIESEVILTIERPQPLEPPEVIPSEPTRRVDTPTGFATETPRWEQPALPGQSSDSIPLSRYMVPLVRATAPYPARAIQRGIEGFVELSFTVNELGRVVNPVILYAEPEGYFERAALNSISKWQYSPALDNGEPVPVHDVRQRIVFQISEN